MKTVREAFTDSVIIKKSEFIGIIVPVQSMNEATDRVAAEWKRHQDARHIAWAANVDNRVRMSDDGEPSGTAGMPILNVIQHQDIDQVLIMVVRYFGGIKLGACGLTRAYSQAASLVVKQANYIEFVAKIEISIVADYGREADIRHLIQKLEGVVLASDYGLQWQASIEIEEKSQSEFINELTNLCQGKVEINLISET